MRCKDLVERRRQVSPEAVDAALRAFWRGSVVEIDRLAGVTGDERLGLGELLLLLLDSAGTAQPARTDGIKQATLPHSLG